MKKKFFISSKWLDQFERNFRKRRNLILNVSKKRYFTISHHNIDFWKKDRSGKGRGRLNWSHPLHREALLKSVELFTWHFKLSFLFLNNKNELPFWYRVWNGLFVILIYYQHSVITMLSKNTKYTSETLNQNQLQTEQFVDTMHTVISWNINGHLDISFL